MLDDVQAVMAFNATRLGQTAHRALRRSARRIWPNLSGQTVLGLGYAAPLLPLWRKQARLCVDAVAAASAAGDPAATSTRLLVKDDALPFPDAAFDRVVMMHAIETADATRLLRGVSRCLRDDGRLLIVVPNRTGLWAIHDGTPFADGAPCSIGRIERLLRRSLFRIETLRGGLFMPPVDALRRAAPLVETAGRHLSPRLSGVLIVEAVKDVHAALPVASTSRRFGGIFARRVLLPMGRIGPVDQASIATPYSSSTSR